jgi:putative sterol carrier protein
MYGGIEIVRLTVGGSAYRNIRTGTIPLTAIEKYAEDFYRLIKQNRIFLRGSEYTGDLAPFAGRHNEEGGTIQNELSLLKSQVDNSINSTVNGPLEPMKKAQDIMDDAKSIDFDIFNEKQAEDIQELTKLFATKLKTDDDIKKNDKPPSPPPLDMNGLSFNPHGRDPELYEGLYTPANDGFLTAQDNSPKAMPDTHSNFAPVNHPEIAIVPREKTVKQMTQKLPHFFQAQIAHDTEAVFQFTITGDEQFNGYLVIKNQDNEYYDGVYDTPDITILADSRTWHGILKGKHTAQKAFMTGQLKVRGNFMLLNRFDQIYKKM